MIEVKNLVKKYGSRIALNQINFSATKGEVLGFLGPNGAGKSTTMNILTGYLSSTSGTVKIANLDIIEEPLQAKSKIGYLPEIPPLYLDMTVKAYLKFIFELKKVKLPKNQHINEIIEKVKISQVSDRIIKNLSKGYKQRVGIAQALLGDPPILILDEPTVGLDPKQIIEIRDLISNLKERRTVILSSHILTEVQAICDRILVINKGRIVADDTTENLSAGMERNHILYAIVEGAKEKIISAIKSIAGVLNVFVTKEKEPGVFEYKIESDKELDIRRQLFKTLSSQDLPLLGLKIDSLSLEEIFLKLTEGSDVPDEMQKNKKEIKNEGDENS
ncbi:MAG: ABC transporter ATP-binding protein [Oscillospiraceae bacterium]|jgi:ABC-2 type transport system ATP-binding protein|nr:ABC transporter ATP-binding protein [Oscillospiraceae bacterium]